VSNGVNSRATVRVTIRLFARLREITGAGELAREVNAPADAQAAWAALAREFPALAQYRAVISCAVNEQYAKFDTPLAEGDEVAFLPPVSGGDAVRVRGSGSRLAARGLDTDQRLGIPD
jgi:molybdopterin converting factor subunit 1